MFRWLSWGGIRGRGLSLKSDVVMSVVAVVMATLVVILLYFFYERNAVKAFCETWIDPAITQTDKVVQRVDKIWDSELLTKTPDPLNPEIDPAKMRGTAAYLNDQLRKDTKELHETSIELANLPTAPNPCEACVDKTGTYVKAADSYATLMQGTIKYLHDLALIEADMNEAARSVQLSGGNIPPQTLLQRDAALAAGLDKIKALKPPSMMSRFHDDTVAFLTAYIANAQQTTAAYIAGDGPRLDVLAQEGEAILHGGRDKLEEDIKAIKLLMLGGQTKILRTYRTSAKEQVYSLQSKYRF